MTISIRNQATAGAIRELAGRTGLTLTEATDRAVRAELARLTAQEENEDAGDRLARMRTFARTMQERAGRGPAPWPTDRDLYDDEGLPR
ncbi:type II toxin-antitoxin system VapB family antitoxin [Agilicoccus flavus]|uniref:type II toxin-antitoxin system VapB family antitoxin n=1 Tax=Agilicoccus flavus TaxID=2775968 RepID=UPI001CF6C9B0|nr:type II toxin-antitoxin system VapB family antitoxin [Agilicoccus flavus]